jgi:hypothetical protein
VAPTFSERVEPRFAVVSVTDAKGRELARGAASRSPANPRTIVRPVPVYLLLSTAKFATLPRLDVGRLMPLMGISSFGRGIADLEAVLALFAPAAGIAVWLGAPAPLGGGAARAGLGARVRGGGAARPRARRPSGADVAAGRALALDSAHLAAGSVWFCGLVRLLVLWAAARRGRRMRALATVVPRLSRVALGSCWPSPPPACCRRSSTCRR